MSGFEIFLGVALVVVALAITITVVGRASKASVIRKDGRPEDRIKKLEEKGE